jgi:hypothetical protein
MLETLKRHLRGAPVRRSAKEVDMYSTKSLNGVPTIQRDGRNVLAVWDEDWRFASNLCDLLNEMDAEPPLLLNEHDRVWLKTMDNAFGRKVQHV